MSSGDAFRLDGKVALVTGGASGIGEATCKELARAGASVIVADINLEAAQALAKSLSNAKAVRMDVTSVESIDAAAGQLERLDILVNNAGMTRDGLLMRMRDEDWESVLAINLTAAFRLSRASLKGMVRRRYGRIINIASVVGVSGNAGQANYAAAKAGMIGMSKALAAEVATRGITVNCIAPGFITSPMTEALDQKRREAILASVPMRRLGSGEEIGAAAVYLASSEAGYVTGQTLHVNGGMAMI